MSPHADAASTSDVPVAPVDSHSSPDSSGPIAASEASVCPGATSNASPTDRLTWFRDARLGLFCHYGLYSLLGRGEWVMNREGIAPREYRKLARRFTARHWDADRFAGLACDLGARYVVFTTKHHEGFCLFDSKLTDFTSVKHKPGRDLVAEVVEAANRRGLKIGLYYSLNDWGSGEPWNHPSGLEAFEDHHAHGQRGEVYRRYIDFIHGQIRELMSNYGRIDLMWYDGWWPFDATGWRAEQMNAMVRSLQGDHILFNNRNGLPGDFATPEQHATLTADRANEACFTLNDSWGYHRHDRNWKTPRDLVDMILPLARASGNLLINVGPRADGAIPAPSLRTLERTGRWIHANERALRPAMLDSPMDWNTHVGFAGSTHREGTVYLHVRHWPGRSMAIAGVRGRLLKARFLDPALGGEIPFTREDGKLTLHELPASPPDPLATVIALDYDTSTDFGSYQTGGLRPPNCPHPQYDPVESNLLVQA